MVKPVAASLVSEQPQVAQAAAGKDAVPKARAYGRGAGRVMRTHLSHPVAWPWILRTIGGLGSIVLPRRFHRFSRRAKSARAHGVIEGILRAGAR